MHPAVVTHTSKRKSRFSVYFRYRGVLLTTNHAAIVINEENSSLPSPPRKMKRLEEMKQKKGALTDGSSTTPFAAGFSPDGLLFGRNMPQMGRPSASVTASLKASNAGVSVRRSLALAEESVSISATIVTGGRREVQGRLQVQGRYSV